MEQRFPRIETVLEPDQEIHYRNQIRDETLREVRARILDTEKRWRGLVRYFKGQGDDEMAEQYRQRATAAGTISRQFGTF